MHVPNSVTTAGLTVLRVGAGLLFMQHGAQKLFGWLGGDQVDAIVSLMGLAGILEFFGGMLIVVGLLTRPVGLVLAAEMVVAYFMAHAPQGPWPINNGGEKVLLFALIFLFLATRGAGAVSVDALFRRRHRPGEATRTRAWRPIEET